MKRVFAFLVVMAFVGLAAGCSSDDSSGPPSCADGCAATLAAKCANGPADQATCESDCNTQSSGKCGTQFKAVRSCAAGKPLSCDADGNVTISGCDKEQQAFIACILQ